MAAKRQVERRTAARIQLDLKAQHLRALGRIRMSLGRYGNPATSTSALRVAIEVLDEQLHPHRVKKPSEQVEETPPEDGITAGLLS